MTRLYLLEPESNGTAWVPFAGVRPIAELRAGAWLVRERWEASLGLLATAVISDPLEGFADVGTAPVVPREGVVGPAIVVRSDFVPARQAIPSGPAPWVLHHDGAPVGWALAEGEPLSEAPAGAADGASVAGIRLRGTTDLLAALEELLPADCAEFTMAEGDPTPSGAIVLGDPGRVVSLGAVVEPGVVFDVRAGAIVLTEGVEVRSGSRLEGPLYVGRATRLLGGRIATSAIGPECRIHGEVAGSVFTGYANKSHDGFVGHSVVGSWVNLGAGTITSNLKNTYGSIRLDLPTGRVETGRQFLGSLVADHAKTAIGTLLGAGTVIGAGANVFGTGTVPRHLPPFSWGFDGSERLGLDGFLRTAERVMPRRGVEVSHALQDSLRRLHGRHAP